jgi:hypothetical protein
MKAVLRFVVAVAALLVSFGVQGARLGLHSDLLLRASERGNGAIRQLIRDHEQQFPGALSRSFLSYPTDLDRLAFHLNQLSLELWRHQPYRTLTEQYAELPVRDLSITAERDYQLRIQTNNSQFRFDDLSGRLRGFLEKTQREQNLGGDRVTQRLRDWLWLTFKRAIKEKNFDFVDGDPGFETLWLAYFFATSMSSNNAWEDLLRRVGSLSYQQTDYLVDPVHIETVMARLDEQGHPLFRNDMRFFLGDILKKWRFKLRDDPALTTSRSVTVRAGTTLRLENVEPHLAVLRGFVGDDCSSSVSFGFPLSPAERVYYIKNQAGAYLGYVSFSLTTVNNKPAIFLHTINGPEILEAETDLVMRAIYDQRKLLGGDSVYLPTNARIDENVNYRPIKSVMTSWNLKPAFDLVTWPDAEVREIIIRHGSSAHYDSPARNSHGNKVKALANAGVTTESSVSKSRLKPRLYGPSQFVKLYCQGAFE